MAIDIDALRGMLKTPPNGAEVYREREPEHSGRASQFVGT